MRCCSSAYKHTLIGTVSKLWLFITRSLSLTNIYQSHQISTGSLTHSLSLPQICEAESSKTKRGQLSKFVIESASDFWAPLAPASSYFQRTNNNIIFSLLALWQYFDVLSSLHAIWRHCVSCYVQLFAFAFGIHWPQTNSVKPWTMFSAVRGTLDDKSLQ